MKKQFRDFESAREFARELKLKSKTYWIDYCKSGNRPDDIPSTPNLVYKKEWKGFGDWLGTGNIQPKNILPFEEAREFVRSLGLKEYPDWIKYCKSGKKPKDIPSAPNQSYKYKGFVSMRNWLGNEWRDFESAREFVRSLGLKGDKEWKEYCMSGYKPDDIPANPRVVYKNKFKGTRDWLGTGWRDFEKAREFVRALNLKGKIEWYEYSKSGNKPKDIPSTPEIAYKKEGWSGYGNWLGTDIVATRLIKYRPFKEAREFVRSLGLKNHKEWQDYVESGNKPDDIPANPWGSYKKIKNFELSKFRDFEKAREFVRSLGLNGTPDWDKYCKSGNKPDDIPSNPAQVYKLKGFVHMRNWVGNEWRDFEKAREFVRELKLKNMKAWNEYYSSEDMPEDIPKNPRDVYKKEFKDLGDWLGTGWRDFEKAREFVRALKLKGQVEWNEYSKSGNKPKDIPSNPNSSYRKEWKGWRNWVGTE